VFLGGTGTRPRRAHLLCRGAIWDVVGSPKAALDPL